MTIDQMNPNSTGNALCRGDMVGVACRSLVVLLLLAFTLVGVLLIQTQFFPESGLSIGQTVVVTMTIAVAMVGGMVLSEYPRGGDLALARMGLATFCRTGVPLVVILVIERYSSVELLDQGIAIIILLYGVGLFSSIILSLLPLRESSKLIKVEA